jgi:hypothetical protein
MASLTGFDANDKSLSNCVPGGDYDLVITKCDLKTTSAGDYEQIHLETKVLNGEFQNRVIFGNYMYRWIGKGDPAEGQKQAINIGRKKFGTICIAVGVPKPNATEDVVGKTFTAKLKIKKSDGFNDQNEIVKSQPRSASSPGVGEEKKGKW